MVTEFGKFLRILRINAGDSARQMADKLGLSPSYLSAIENGKRNIPNNMQADLIINYNLSETESNEVKKIINRNATWVSIVKKMDTKNIVSFFVCSSYSV